MPLPMQSKTCAVPLRVAPAFTIKTGAFFMDED